MALLFMDGFDWAASASDLIRKWDSAIIGFIGTSYGRLGGKGIYLSGSIHLLQKYVPSKTTIYLGFALYFNNSGTGVYYNSSYPFINFLSDSTTQVRFHFNSNTSCRFYNGVSGTQIGTDITVPNINNKWIYVEIKLTISDTVGAIILKINGTEYYNGTNLDTRNGTPTDINNIKFNFLYNDYTWIDDVYIDDSQFHGDVRVRTIYPDANGSENDFTVYPSGSNYQAVDDSGDSDDDSTYNYNNNVGDRDLYGVTAPTLATVKAVAVNNCIRKDDAGTRKTKNVVRSGGSNYLGTEFVLGDSYLVNQHIWELDPADSTAWTKTKIDNAEFGLEITA
jgi:hypothetical protein